MLNSIEERGRAKGLRVVVRKLVEKKFGPLQSEVNERLEGLPAEKLEEIVLAILDAESLDELGLTAE